MTRSRRGRKFSALASYVTLRVIEFHIIGVIAHLTPSSVITVNFDTFLHYFILERARVPRTLERIFANSGRYYARLISNQFTDSPVRRFNVLAPSVASIACKAALPRLTRRHRRAVSRCFEAVYGATRCSCNFRVTCCAHESAFVSLSLSLARLLARSFRGRMQETLTRTPVFSASCNRSFTRRLFTCRVYIHMYVCVYTYMHARIRAPVAHSRDRHSYSEEEEYKYYYYARVYARAFALTHTRALVRV